MKKKQKFGGWGRNLDHKQIEKDRLAGMSVRKIAEKHGCAQMTVWDILRNKAHELPQNIWIKLSQRDYRALHLAALRHGTDIKTMASAIMADAIDDVISEEHLSEWELSKTPHEIKELMKQESENAG